MGMLKVGMLKMGNARDGNVSGRRIIGLRGGDRNERKEGEEKRRIDFVHKNIRQLKLADT